MSETDLRTVTIIEGETPRLTYTVTDAEGNAIAGSALTTITAKVVSMSTGAVVDGWDDTDIKDLQNNAVDESGNGVWDPVPASAIAKAAAGDKEDLMLIITWTWDTPTKTGKHRVLLRILEGH